MYTYTYICTRIKAYAHVYACMQAYEACSDEEQQVLEQDSLENTPPK